MRSGGRLGETERSGGGKGGSAWARDLPRGWRRVRSPPPPLLRDGAPGRGHAAAPAMPRASFAPRGIAPLWQDGGKKNKKKKCASATLSGTSLAGARTAGVSRGDEGGGKVVPQPTRQHQEERKNVSTKKTRQGQTPPAADVPPAAAPYKERVRCSKYARPPPPPRATHATDTSRHGGGTRRGTKVQATGTRTAPQPPRHRHGRGRVPAPPALARRRRRAVAVPGTTTADKETKPQAMPDKGDWAQVPSP